MNDAGRILGAFFALLGFLSMLLIGASWTLRRAAAFLTGKSAARQDKGARR